MLLTSQECVYIKVQEGDNEKINREGEGNGDWGFSRVVILTSLSFYQSQRPTQCTGKCFWKTTGKNFLQVLQRHQWWRGCGVPPWNILSYPKWSFKKRRSTFSSGQPLTCRMWTSVSLSVYIPPTPSLSFSLSFPSFLSCWSSGAGKDKGHTVLKKGFKGKDSNEHPCTWGCGFFRYISTHIEKH